MCVGNIDTLTITTFVLAYVFSALISACAKSTTPFPAPGHFDIDPDNPAVSPPLVTDSWCED